MPKPKETIPPTIESWENSFCHPSKLPISFLSTMASKQQRVLSIAVEANLDTKEVVGARLLEGMGTQMASGALRVQFTDGNHITNGLLGLSTADSMTGGALWIDGDVQRISHVFGGTILVNGYIGELCNICKDTMIICTNNIGGHIYTIGGVPPSPHIYGANKGAISYHGISVDQWKNKLQKAQVNKDSPLDFLEYINVHIDLNLKDLMGKLSSIPSGTLLEQKVCDILNSSLGYKETIKQLFNLP